MQALVSQLPLLLVVSTLLFVLVWSFSRLVGDRMPHLRLVLWVIVLVRLIAPPSLLITLPIDSSWLDALPSRSLVAAHSVAPESAESAEMRPGPGATDWFTLLVLGTWFAGGSLSLGRWFVARRRQLRVVRRSAEDAGPMIIEALREWQARLKVSRAVEVLVSRDAKTAFTAGLVRPTIYLPAELERRLSRDALATVIAHELAHVKRLDDLWLFLETLVKSIYFFHPVAWLATARLREVREQLSDELVIDAGTIDGRRYGSVLLDSLLLRRDSATVPALLESSKRSLERRLVRVANHRRPRRRTVALLFGALVSLLVIPTGLGASPDVVSSAEIPLQHPLPGARVTSHFGPRSDPFSGAASVHRGIDFAGGRDDLVLAAAPGKVVVATETYEPAPDQGTVVVIQHRNDLHTVSSHLGELLVGEGDVVSAGQPIARIGSTGRVTGPHLHFEVIRGSDPVDPLPWITGRRK